VSTDRDLLRARDIMDQISDLIAAYIGGSGDSGPGDEVTGPTDEGGALVAVEDVPVLADALADAIAYRHADLRTDAYVTFARKLGIEVDR
jgi:hypothetical protein